MRTNVTLSILLISLASANLIAEITLKSKETQCFEEFYAEETVGFRITSGNLYKIV